MLRITATVLGIVVAIIGGYIFWQYRTARPPALDSIPIYSARLAVPITDIPEPQRTATEQELRNLASTAQPGYRVADERILATKGRFVWDALRHNVAPQLGSRGYALVADGWSSNYAITYHAYCHNELRRRFNDDVIVVAGFLKTTVKTVGGDEVYVYGYFRLTPN
jgi:hypothetical protein